MNIELTVENAFQSLRDAVNEAFSRDSVEWKLCDRAIDSTAFCRAPGSRGHHHAFAGGLCLHTAEVVRECGRLGRALNWPVLLIAAVWHDFAKIYEYVIEPDGSIVGTTYRDSIGHVAGSVLALFAAAETLGDSLSAESMDRIAHCMLAHHGRREWGSPVEPQTPEAWVLHSADMLSSRGKTVAK